MPAAVVAVVAAVAAVVVAVFAAAVVAAAVVAAVVVAVVGNESLSDCPNVPKMLPPSCTNSSGSML